MGLGYSYVSKPITVVGTERDGSIRYSDMAFLADGYASGALGTVICGAGCSKVNLYFVYTMGASETTNSLEFILEGTNREDGKDFCRFVNDATSGATSTLTKREFTIVGSDAATIFFTVPISIQDRHLRVRCKETGVVTNFGKVHCRAVFLGEK